MTREEEIRSRMDAYDKTLGKSIDVQLESWRPVNESAVTDLRFMLGVVDKERKENQRLRGAFEWIATLLEHREYADADMLDQIDHKVSQALEGAQ